VIPSFVGVFVIGTNV